MSFDITKDKSKKVHFIGIGGISMSGLAEILLEAGYKVTGSDLKSSAATDTLSNLGAEVFIGHDEKNISGADLVVYTAAVSSDNPELLAAKKLGITAMDRAEFLGDLMKGYKYNVAVAGTHGKTTTTSMLSHIVLKANLDPTILVGGQLDVIHGNVRTGKSQYLITEACEYKASFLKFIPHVGIITNIDADHLDFYKDIEDIQNTFMKFSALIPVNGYLVCCAENEWMEKVMKAAKCTIITYGIDKGDFTAKNIAFNEKGCASFSAYFRGDHFLDVILNVPGMHNVLNALACIGTSFVLDISKDCIFDGLKEFGGTHRRFELKGNKGGVVVIDDYAHHPTELKATLSAAKNYPHKRIFCVFQPHTFSRTLSLFEEFSNAFDGVDDLILADIYAAREKDTGIVSSAQLAEKINEKGLKCQNLHSFDEIVSYLEANLKEGDVLFTAGAGDVYKVGEMYLEK
ncbi:MAG TPA: UDP-N-acetylmuramate--L-alanine ligase [Clostridiaceae bacterium]|nr:UDP-N-acetylmuramate--L-alanine ligase [Clostridiaceae bacterium]